LERELLRRAPNGKRDADPQRCGKKIAWTSFRLVAQIIPIFQNRSDKPRVRKTTKAASREIAAPGVTENNTSIEKMTRQKWWKRKQSFQREEKRGFSCTSRSSYTCGAGKTHQRILKNCQAPPSNAYSHFR